MSGIERPFQTFQGAFFMKEFLSKKKGDGIEVTFLGLRLRRTRATKERKRATAPGIQKEVKGKPKRMEKQTGLRQTATPALAP